MYNINVYLFNRFSNPSNGKFQKLQAMSEHLQKFKDKQSVEMGNFFEEVLPKVVKALPMLKVLLVANTKFIPVGKTVLISRNGKGDPVILQFDTPTDIEVMRAFIPSTGVEVSDIDKLIKMIFGIDTSDNSGTAATTEPTDPQKTT